MLSVFNHGACFNIELKMSSCCSGSLVLNTRLNRSVDKSSLKAFHQKVFRFKRVRIVAQILQLRSLKH